MIKIIVTFLFVLSCSQGFCETADQRLEEMEAIIADLQISPKTTQDSLVSVLNETWPTVPHILNELLGQARKHEKGMDRLSNQADFFMERLKESYEMSTENQKVNFRQDVEISSLQKEQIVIAGRQDKMEGTWAGIIKGSAITIAGFIASVISGILIILARAGLWKKIFGNKSFDRRKTEEEAEEEVVKNIKTKVNEDG